MGDKTAIAWTSKTFNLAFGCTKISPGCKACYAENLTKRYYGQGAWGPQGTRKTFGEKHWTEPLNWNRKAEREGTQYRVFSSSMADNFEDHPVIIGELKKLWPLIKATPRLTWQLLTKRADRIALSLPADWGSGYSNVWLGVSIENNDYVHRAEVLKKIPAVVHFISYEPALGPVPDLNLDGIEWVIVGGESGPEFREMDHAWAREVRDRCVEKGIAFFFKQSSALYTERGTALREADGTSRMIREYPDDHAKPQSLF